MYSKEKKRFSSSGNMRNDIYKNFLKHVFIVLLQMRYLLFLPCNIISDLSSEITIRMKAEA